VPILSDASIGDAINVGGDEIDRLALARICPKRPVKCPRKRRCVTTRSPATIICSISQRRSGIARRISLEAASGPAIPWGRPAGNVLSTKFRRQRCACWCLVPGVPEGIVAPRCNDLSAGFFFQQTVIDDQVTGKKTPGVDQIIWKTPEDKIRAVHALKSRGYQSQPLRRVYIPNTEIGRQNDASARNSLHDRSSSPSLAFAGTRSGAGNQR